MITVVLVKFRNFNKKFLVIEQIIFKEKLRQIVSIELLNLNAIHKTFITNKTKMQIK